MNEVESTPVAVAAVEEAPLIKASEGPAKAVAPSAPVKLALADVPASKPKVKSSTHLVQLGAFSNAANAAAAWNKYSKRYGVLGGMDSASSTVTVNGKKLVRLAAMGFASGSAANAACSKIKAQGGVCLVRTIGAEKPVLMASASGRKIAAR